MKKLIMIVDDDPITIELLGHYLPRAEFEVVHAMSGEEGLARLDGKVDLILCDINLMGMDGVEFGRRVRASEQFKAVPLIAITGVTRRRHREQALEVGFDLYLEKPVDPAELLKIIRARVR